MASRAQRIGIWVIAVAMIIGTVVGFLAMIISNQNTQKSQEFIQKYQKAVSEYQTKVQAQTNDLSHQYFSTFNTYASVPAKFDATAVTELKTEDLLVGSGAEVNDKTQVAVYYIGWNPEGKIFDQSIDGTNLRAPIDPSKTIDGFKRGVIGMHIGGVREITIPANDAYGKDGNGEDIPPNTPIKFVVMAIPKPAEIKQPTLPVGAY